MLTLKEEEPFACVPYTNFLPTICSFCFADKKPLIKCRGCRLIYYCDKKCQKSDSVNHKKECCLVKRAMELPGPIVRLTSRILLMSEKALAQKAFNGRTWDSIDDFANLTDGRLTKVVFNQLAGNVVEFMNPMKIVSLEEAEKALRKVITHQIAIYNSDGVENVGIGIYLGLSAHNHNCASDSQLLFTGTKASLRSFDPERTTYSDDLVISFTGISPWILYRKNLFVQKYLLDCECSLCVDENHIFNRMGSSCRVDCCLNSAGILDENSKGPYKCNKCGAASDITVKEVKRAETKIQNFLTQMKDPKYIFDVKEVRRIVHDSEKVLSVYNYHFMALCGDVVDFTTSRTPFTAKDVQVVCTQLYDKKLKAMRYYHHETDIRMATSLMHRAGLKIVIDDSADNFDLSAALEAGINAYGENHRAVVYFKELLERYRKLNEQKRDHLFRAAGQYAW